MAGVVRIEKDEGVRIDEAEFRQVLGHFASGVTVVTMHVNGQLHGLTVSAFASLSLDPPLVLICIDRHYPSHTFLTQAGTFAINILAEDGERLSRHFASRAEDKFTGIAYHAGLSGAPLLDDALATLECRHVNTLPGGDHSIFVAEVLATATHEGKPLLYYRSGYSKLA